MIPKEEIDQVKAASDIVDLIGGYVKLRRAGAAFKGLCPFHNEKTPSFTVSPARQHYKCFGCGNGGGIIDFVCQVEGLEFVAAVRFLADRAGITLTSERGDKQAAYRATLKQYNGDIRDFYCRQLTGENGALARNYLAARGIEKATIEHFELGYALPGWDGIMRYARDRKIEYNYFEKLGLIIPRTGSDGFYDRYRQRLIFPIRDLSGHVIAFGGRVVPPGDDQAAKYINSPETPIYHKGDNLFGIFLNKDEIRRSGTVLVVEGYLDLISIWQSGFRNVVATLGTALTEQQLRILLRYARQVVLLYDGDQAGLDAAMRFGERNIGVAEELRIATLPSGQDPDDLVRSEGAAGLQQIISAARGLFDFGCYYHRLRLGGDEPQSRRQLIMTLLELAGKVGDELKRELLIKKLARDFMVPEHKLQQALSRVRMGHAARPRPVVAASKEGLREKPSARALWESSLLAMLLSAPSFADICQRYLPKESFSTNQELAGKLYEHCHSGQEAAAIGTAFTDGTALYLAAVDLLFMAEKYDLEAATRGVPDVLVRLVEDGLRAHSRQIVEQIRSCSSEAGAGVANKEATIKALYQEKMDIARRIMDVRAEIMANFTTRG